MLDGFQRPITYLRLSVTEACNLRCTYCRPAALTRQAREGYLTFDEITRLVGIFSALAIQKVRLTGGEPLARKNLAALAAQITTTTPIKTLALSTNATRLATEAAHLYAAGVRGVNVSLDTLKAETFARMTGGHLHKVLAGIKAARDAGLQPIKVNMVVMAGTNDDEIEDMLDWAATEGVELRFIEVMPIGTAGIVSMQQHVSAESILARISAHRGSDITAIASAANAGPASCYQVATREGAAQSFGIISAVSKPFCATCNRIRLTATGVLTLCLGQQDSVCLRTLLRGGASNVDITAAITTAIGHKPERHVFTERRQHIAFRPMIAIGG